MTDKDAASTDESGAEIITDIERALTHLVGCVRNATFYGLQHRVVRECLANTAKAFDPLLSGPPELVFTVRPGEIIYGNMPLPGTGGALLPLAEILYSREVGRISFRQGLSERDLEALTDALLLESRVLRLRGGVAKALADSESQHILVEPPVLLTSAGEESAPREAIEIYNDAVDIIKRAMAAAEGGLFINAGEVRAVVESMLESITYDSSALISLAAIKSYDEYLYEHSVNVCIVSMVFGHSLGLPEGQLVELGVSALVHDVGKVLIPLELVRRPGSLTEEEWTIMQTHPALGAKALVATPTLPELACVVAFEHHMRHDHSGFPKVRWPKPLNFFSQIVAIVDCYDSLTTVRPYLASLRPEQAGGWMAYCGRKQFEPRLLSRFCGLLNISPVGALVELNAGEWGVVAGAGADLAHPVVRILVDGDGATVQGAQYVDLGELDTQTGGQLRTIRRRLEPVSKVAQVTALLGTPEYPFSGEYQQAAALSAGA
jgi:HD-GYP domain-containing protein (c-di-GMP phosphodiesterase class II)